MVLLEGLLLPLLRFLLGMLPGWPLVGLLLAPA